jgi:hypothetical protein
LECKEGVLFSGKIQVPFPHPALPDASFPNIMLHLHLARAFGGEGDGGDVKQSHDHMGNHMVEKVVKKEVWWPSVWAAFPRGQSQPVYNCPLPTQRRGHKGWVSF